MLLIPVIRNVMCGGNATCFFVFLLNVISDYFVVVALHFCFAFKINAAQNHVEWAFLCYGL